MENLKDLLDLMGHGEVLANQRVNGLESGWEYLEICELSRFHRAALGLSLLEAFLIWWSPRKTNIIPIKNPS
jgi:hypothetical protein